MTDRGRRQFLKLLGGAAAAVSVPRATEAATRDAVIDAAKGESGLVWYDHYYTEAANAGLSAFQRAHPFVKKVEFVDTPSAQKTAKIAQESMAGGPTTDVLLNDAATQQSMTNRGWTLETDWAALGVATSPVMTPSPSMILVITAPYVALYNTDLVKGADVPQSWDDMVAPKWKGRTGHWMRASFFVDLIPAMGEDKARDLLSRLIALQPRLFDGQFPMAQAIGSGEIALAAVAYDSSVRIIEKGAPAKMAPIDPTPLPLICGAVMKYGKNPNTARLFLAWLGTPEGAITFEKMTKRGNFFVDGTATAKFFKGHKMSYRTAEESIAQATKLTALEAEFSRKLAGR
jgi:iron(III) transport system substrate-binding protein